MLQGLIESLRHISLSRAMVFITWEARKILQEVRLLFMRSYNYTCNNYSSYEVIDRLDYQPLFGKSSLSANDAYFVLQKKKKKKRKKGTEDGLTDHTQ